jgi:endonuclease/exonuclease/phosphatase family metal-dependent hydrolase
MRKIRVLLALVCLSVSLAGCTFQRQGVAAAPKSVEVRVLSYNIHHGEGLDKRVDLERIARVVEDTRADLVALQEVDKGVQRSKGLDEPARMGELTGMQPVFEKNINYQGGEYGNAVLSRLPVLSHENHPLPQSVANEQRGMLEVRVQAGGQPLIFVATHFSYYPEEVERLASVESFRKLADEKGDVPVIMAGDLNARPDSQTVKNLNAFLSNACPPGAEGVFTFPADKPDIRIDYIFYTRNPRVRCVEYKVVPEEVASDHRPILAVFEVAR